MKENPYIGITGPTTRQEVDHILDTFEANGFNREQGHEPMIGFLVALKSLKENSMANRRYPDFSNLPSLLEATGGYTFNTIHYNSRELSTLGDQLVGVFSQGVYEEDLSRAVQVNIPWPPIAELRRAKAKLPDLKFIIQLSCSALRDRSPREVADLLATYGELANYTLIDPSGGQGIPFEPETVLPYYEAIKDKLPDLTVGLAGGFSGENVVERVNQIVGLIGTDQFSIDAEGALRDKVTDTFGDDIYNPKKVELFVAEAAQVF